MYKFLYFYMYVCIYVYAYMCKYGYCYVYKYWLALVEKGDALKERYMYVYVFNAYVRTCYRTIQEGICIVYD
jgi:hypothetical protein